MKRILTMFAVLVLVAVALGACGKSEENVDFVKVTPPSQETTAGAQTQETTKPEETTPQAAGETKPEEATPPATEEAKPGEMTTSQEEPKDNPATEQISTNNEWFTNVLEAKALSQTSVSLSWNNPDGKAVNFSDKGAKLYLIDVWAQWCPPCRASTPTMISLYNKYKANGLMVIGLNVDTTDAIYKAQEFAQSEGIQYPVVNDPQSSKIGGIFVGQGIPAFTLVDAEGTVLFQNEGAITQGSTEENKLESIIRSKLGL